MGIQARYIRNLCSGFRVGVFTKEKSFAVSFGLTYWSALSIMTCFAAMRVSACWGLGFISQRFIKRQTFEHGF